MRSSPNCSLSAASSPEEGSSSNRIRGPRASALASSTSRPWPVEISPARRSARGSRPASSSSSSATARTSARSFRELPARPSCVRGSSPIWAASAASSTFSRTVKDPNSSMRWNVRPSPSRARRAGLSAVTSRPPSRTTPSSGFWKPQHTLNRVVFPAPFGPISPVIRPTGASTPTPPRATSPPNFTTTSCADKPTDVPGMGSGAVACSEVIAVMEAPCWSEEKGQVRRRHHRVVEERPTPFNHKRAAL